jgi:hypothetical protein
MRPDRVGSVRATRNLNGRGFRGGDQGSLAQSLIAVPHCQYTVSGVAERADAADQ